MIAHWKLGYPMVSHFQTSPKKWADTTDYNRYNGMMSAIGSTIGGSNMGHLTKLPFDGQVLIPSRVIQRKLKVVDTLDPLKYAGNCRCTTSHSLCLSIHVYIYITHIYMSTCIISYIYLLIWTSTRPISKHHNHGCCIQEPASVQHQILTATVKMFLKVPQAVARHRLSQIVPETSLDWFMGNRQSGKPGFFIHPEVFM